MTFDKRNNPKSATRAGPYYFEILLETTDPVYWSEEELLEVREALSAARERGHDCTAAAAILTSAILKASYPNVSGID
ncbi:hypothetical protein KGQ25_02200 [Patescibacteria group bacterium]|nr:hypothetical protein [Patescibacteria group bacterium]MDE2173448.1 hypothetical protein [Patescibacteria group bacterium]